MDELIQQPEQIQESKEPVVEAIPEDEPDIQSGDIKEPEISIDNDGEVSFSDDFFDEPAEAKPRTEPETPNYYTDDELRDLPYEQWDKARMPDDVRRYAEAIQIQNEKKARQQELQQRTQNPPSFLVRPKELTPQDLHNESLKLAVQRLGLNSSDDFDEYEGVHRAALDMARQEIIQKNASETADYQRKIGEYQQFQGFSAQLAGQADVEDFHQWYLDEIRKNGNTPEQINQGLARVAREQGFGAITQIWSEFYRQYKASRAQSKNIQPPRKTRASTPPSLESTRVGNYDGRKNVDLRNFGELDEDAQVQALMDMGLV